MIGTRKFGIIMAAGVIVACLLGFTAFRNRTVELPVSGALATNIRYAHATDDHTVWFFSGSAFASFDTKNGKSKPLTRFYRLPNVTAVRWGSDGALFQANHYGVVDELYPTLTQYNLDTSASYWWYVDFSTGGLRLVGADTGITTGNSQVRDVVWSTEPGTYYYLVASKLNQNDTTNPLLYKVIDGQTTTLGPLSATTLLEAKPDLVVYAKDLEAGSALYYYHPSTRQNRVVSSNFVGDVALSGDSRQALLTSNLDSTSNDTEVSSDNTAGILSILDSNSLDQTIVTNSFSGGIVWQGSQWLALQTDGTGYRGTAGKVDHIALKNADLTLTHDSLCGYRQEIACLTDDRANLYVAGKNIPVSSSTKSITALQKGKLVPDKYEISYDDSRKQFDIYVYGDSTVNSKRAVEYIRSLGLDPYQVNLHWYTDSTQPLTTEGV